MPVTKAHLAWFKLKCPYPPTSQAYKQAYAKLNNATNADLEKLRAEFDEYEDNSISVRHYKYKGQWYATGGSAKEGCGVWKTISSNERLTQINPKWLY